MVVRKEHIRFKASRSDKPGGMNRDHRATKVHAWIKVGDLPLTEAEKRLVRIKIAHHINHNDEIWVECQEERSQEENREHAVEHLNNLIGQALEVLPPRIPTEPTRAADRERLHEKHHHGITKRERTHAHHPDETAEESENG